MVKKPVISSAQLMLMTAGSALMFPYTFMPILSAPPANQDAWVVLLMTGAYIVALDTPLLFLMNKFRGMDINGMAETVLGKFFGKAAAVIIALTTLICFSACMLMAAVFLSLYVLPETPTWALLMYMIIPAMYGALKGAGTIGRLAVFIVPFIIFTIIAFLFLGFGLMDFKELQPAFADSTFLELNQGAFLTSARYTEIIIFTMFSFYLKRNSSINRTYAAALGIYIVCFFVMLIPTLTVLGAELGKHVWNPYFVFTRQVGGYDFIKRVHSLNILAFFPGMILKLMIYIFMGSQILSGVVKAKSYKGFIIPMSAIGFCICLLPVMNKSSTIELLRSDMVFPFLILPATFILPAVIVIVYFFRRKRIKAILDSINE